MSYGFGFGWRGVFFTGVVVLGFGFGFRSCHCEVAGAQREECEYKKRDCKVFRL